MTCRIAITTGEPAGVGPDIFAKLSLNFPSDVEIIALGDLSLLKERARLQNINLELHEFQPQTFRPSSPGQCSYINIPLSKTCTPGVLNKDNASYVIASLEKASQLCLNNICQAICTAPVHKGIINEAGLSFSGHTEFFAQKANIEKVVMMLATTEMRVALVTTHLPLRDVAQAITKQNVEQSLRILHTHLQKFCSISKPKILVAGLNPHAGENGYLGHEEIEIINPVIEKLTKNGMDIEGSLPADTLFTKTHIDRADAILAMYHDQGLPVLKYSGFHQAANITLGLPYIRTSVDHGTALNLAGSGQAHVGSFQTALQLAIEMSQTHA